MERIKSSEMPYGVDGRRLFFCVFYGVKDGVGVVENATRCHVLDMVEK